MPTGQNTALLNEVVGDALGGDEMGVLIRIVGNRQRPSLQWHRTSVEAGRDAVCKH